MIKSDISEFYARVEHRRLEAALRECTQDHEIVSRIMEFLHHYSDERGLGLPVGGPASRLLSEVFLSRVDEILHKEGIPFCRFADDYHVFAPNEESAHRNLVRLISALHDRTRLTLQKLKTQVMPSSEYVRATEASITDAAKPSSLVSQAILAKRMRDPYAPNAPDQNVEELSDELEQHGLLEALSLELAKTRIHESATRELVKLIRVRKEPVRSEAVMMLMRNLTALSPVLSTVLLVVRDVIDSLRPDAAAYVCDTLARLLATGSAFLKPAVHASYAIQILAKMRAVDSRPLFAEMFEATDSPIVRREIIQAMAHAQAHAWLLTCMADFASAHRWERRALIVASYALGAEGARWRDSVRQSFDAVEQLVDAWADQREDADGGNFTP